ncbi:MAG TPA: peptidoglycan-binding domain-containing protein, partial [Phytomonospora sp.]
MSRHLRLLLIAIAGAVALVASATPAAAYPNAYFHTQSAGNRGADTLAVQYLLQHHGQTATADGIFGSGTTAAVRAFQTAKGP